MSNKRDLRAFVRFDGSGRIVAGSLILRKNKPKVGKWHEIQAYECCNYIPTTTTTTTATPTTTTTTTLGPPTENINLYYNGILCGVETDWSAKTPAEVKCDWIELFAGGSASYGGGSFLYYTSEGFNVGTQLYNTTPGNPPITFSGTYIYYLTGSYLTAKVFTLTTGVISAIYELADLPVCEPYICPTTTTTTTPAP